MPDQPNQPRNLSEISHLFLSSIRSKTGARPQRTPPRTDLTIDLTPEEFAEVFGEKDNSSQPQIAPVQAMLAAHLGSQQLPRVREYASHLCMQHKRVGLICVDASEFRLSIFEQNPNPQPQSAQPSDVLDGRRMSESLTELAWDVDQWLLLLPSPRTPEARALLRDISQWTLLTTCDHEGVVACYRTVKGLSDLHRPMLSLATLGSTSESEANNAYQRLASVCRQFLDWPLENQCAVVPMNDVIEHVVLWCNAARDKGQMAVAPQWQVVAEFLAKAKKSMRTKIELPAAAPVAIELESHPLPIAAEVPQVAGDDSQIIDLPNHEASPASIVSAVLRGHHELVECPVKAPACPDAALAVSRDHRLVLIAVASHGLNDLRQIGRAYQWLIENRSLIGMAVPQLSIDAHQLPRVQLLVDHADISADVLQPILHSSTVTVHAYRKLRWGGKTGLLLEAA